MLNITYGRYVNMTNNLDNLYIKFYDIHYMDRMKSLYYCLIPIPVLLSIFVIYILHIRNSFKNLYEKIHLVHEKILKKRLNELKKLSIVFGQLKNHSNYENINVLSIIDYIEKNYYRKITEPSTRKTSLKQRSLKSIVNIKKKKSIKFFNLRSHCFILLTFLLCVIIFIIVQRLQAFEFFRIKDRMAIFLN